ncbi:hypothetical protein [Alteriqipengyuania sp. 357]
MIRAKIPALDRIAFALERRAFRLAMRRAQCGRSAGGDSWRSPDRLWPDFGDD